MESSSSPQERDSPQGLVPRRLDGRGAALFGLFLLALLVALRVARLVVLPLVLAFMLSFLLTPLVRALERARIPRPAGAALVVLGLLALVSFAGHRLSGPAANWLQRAPHNLQHIEWEIRELSGTVEQVSEATKSVENLTEMGDEESREPSVQLEQDSLGQQLFTNARIVATVSLSTLIITFFLLVRAPRLVRKILKVMPSSSGKKQVLTISRSLQRDLSTYLGTITLINIGLGVAIGLAMWGLGVPNPILWGAMATLLNFVPYFGAVIGIGVMTLVALLTFDGVWNVLLPPLTYLFLTSVEGYFVTPMILGRWLTLEPLIVLLSVIFWGWLWGATGAVLAVPLMVCIKIFCDNIDALQPVGKLLAR